jgi:hypothetical protein
MLLQYVPGGCWSSRRQERGGFRMKDVTITVVKSEKGYRVIVNDDSVTAINAEGDKGNDSAFEVGDKDKAREKVQSILSDLE